MKAVVQRVSKAQVSSGGEVVGRIGKGFMVLFGVHCDDTEDKIAKMAEKIYKLRIFDDADGKMNLSLKDVGGEVLVVSQFTLYGDTEGNNRPSFIKAARPEKALPFYERFVSCLIEKGLKVETGKFGNYMQVELVNDGPTTIIIDI